MGGKARVRGGASALLVWLAKAIIYAHRPPDARWSGRSWASLESASCPRLARSHVQRPTDSEAQKASLCRQREGPPRHVHLARILPSVHGPWSQQAGGVGSVSTWGVLHQDA